MFNLFSLFGRYSEPAELRNMLPVYCKNCKRYLGEDDEHDDFCPVEIEKQRAAARWRPKGEASFKEMALAYAIFVVLLGAAAIVWFKFL